MIFPVPEERYELAMDLIKISWGELAETVNLNKLTSDGAILSAHFDKDLDLFDTEYKSLLFYVKWLLNTRTEEYVKKPVSIHDIAKAKRFLQMNYGKLEII